MSGLAGRFMGRDPIGYIGSDWNLYEYVKNRPLIEVDPSGNCPKKKSEECQNCDDLAVICYGVAAAACAIDLLEFAVCASAILPHWDEPCTWFIPFAPAGSPARIACCAAHHSGECLLKLGLCFVGHLDCYREHDCGGNPSKPAPPALPQSGGGSGGGIA